MSDLKEITCLLPERLKRIVETEVMVPGKNGFCKLSEIRIRINRPAILMYNNNKEKVIENIKITSDDNPGLTYMRTEIYIIYKYTCCT